MIPKTRINPGALEKPIVRSNSLWSALVRGTDLTP